MSGKRFRTAWAHGIALLILTLTFVAGSVTAGPALLSPRLDPTLRLLLLNRRLNERAEAAAATASVVDVTIRAVRDVSAAVAALGGDVRTALAAEGLWVLTARVPLARLAELARVPGVIAVAASEPVQPALDRSVADIRADAVWALTYAGLPVTGKGVLIGVVDTGIDWRHPDFWDDAGRSRIVALWDQTTDGAPPVGWDYGTEWQRWQIEAGLATETDENGHGTHMAGIAGGAGQADARYTGVAPDAEFVIVKAILDTAHVIDAWQYIVVTARRLGRPVVINNSFGSHSGAHDGTGDLETALNALAGPGVLFVAAAGNEGESAMHAGGWVPQTGEVTVRFTFTEDYPRSYADLNLWYEGSDRFGVSVTVPTGESFGPVAPGAFQRYTASDGTSVIIDAVSAPWPVNGDNWVRIRLDRETGEALEGLWSFTLHGLQVTNGRFDVWLSTGPWDQAYFLDHVEAFGTLREPGTAKKAISVGGYVTKNCWQGMDGAEYCGSYVEHALFPSSSRGPTRDGRLKPEIAAPGMLVFAARSEDASLTDPRRVAPGGRYEGLGGTSISTAHITGVLALMLQVDPLLDPAAARAILQVTARTDVYTGPTWSPAWGFGKVDALAAVQTVLRRVANRQFLPLIARAPQPALTSTPPPGPTFTPTLTATPFLVPSPGSPTPLRGAVGERAGKGTPTTDGARD